MVDTPGAADRNLLFGILALQMDFISRDQLVSAMGAWVLAKQKPLAQVLEEQGVLSKSRRLLLEPLVNEHTNPGVLRHDENDSEFRCQPVTFSTRLSLDPIEGQRTNNKFSRRRCLRPRLFHSGTLSNLKRRLPVARSLSLDMGPHVDWQQVSQKLQDLCANHDIRA